MQIRITEFFHDANLHQTYTYKMWIWKSRFFGRDAGQRQTNKKTNLVSSSADKTVKIWDTSTGTRTETLDHDNWPFNISYASERSLLASCTSSGIHIWCMKEGYPQSTLIFVKALWWPNSSHILSWSLSKLAWRRMSSSTRLKINSQLERTRVMSP